MQLARPADTTKSLIYQVKGLDGGDTVDYTMHATRIVNGSGKNQRENISILLFG